MLSPCMNCKNRKLKCHSNCNKYLLYKEKLNNKNKIIKKKKEKRRNKFKISCK